MKYVVKKVIKGNKYYYLQFENHSKSLGTALPDDIKKQLLEFFRAVGVKKSGNLPADVVKLFPFKNLQRLEEAHYWYLCVSKNELFEAKYKDMMLWFAILFTYNSNRAEGSKVTRPEIEKFASSTIKKPKTRTDREIFNSFRALEYAFSNNMRWNLKNIRKIHELLLEDLDDPLIVGKWKNENNTAPGNQTTTRYASVPAEMKQLMKWLLKQMKSKPYPPILALQLYLRFEKIHPFLDGNGRVGRILLNGILHKYNYMPTVFFNGNHKAHCEAIKQALEGRNKKLYKHFIEQTDKTYLALAPRVK